MRGRVHAEPFAVMERSAVCMGTALEGLWPQELWQIVCAHNSRHWMAAVILGAYSAKKANTIECQAADNVPARFLQTIRLICVRCGGCQVLQCRVSGMLRGYTVGARWDL
jgi:hypothetical protein